jgi:anti-sigma-K factor RskA
MSHAVWLEQAELYAAGVLDGSELSQFEAHLAARCPLCEALIRETREALTAMVRGLKLVAPPAPARAAVLDAIGSRATARPRWSVSWRLAWGLSAAAATLLAVVVLRQPAGMMIVQMRPMPDMPPASGQVEWNPATGRGMMLAERLPQAPEGKTYQLWALAGGTPMPAGTFSVDAHGRARMPVPTLPADKPVDAFAVTMEPEGGMPSPTGPMYLMGKVS